MKIYEDETLEELTKFNMKIIQKKNGFRFSLDAVLISNFVKIDNKRKINLLDIGTGTGIIPLLLVNNENINTITGVELQENIASMSKRSVLINKLEDKIKIENIDIKDYEVEKKFDMIVTNPPYMKVKNGKVSNNLIKAISRHELKLDLNSLIESSNKVLKDGGSFNIIYRSKRFQELVNVITKHNFHIKRLRFIHTKVDKNAELFMLEAIKNRKKNIAIETPLNVYSENGKYSSEVESYY
ncbi:tRNA1(Val) (adenine(37)-N6)-methyltransferase [Haliovirga abyssi]|uniref:Methyltransferase small domain-containing protein n=1 Tax=Haliovirga abyssi TaxID=2996794 RepID=A0AAU9E2R1_9FUSO|nr:methyltransferase [Haliovirga abyssi]BDU50685.1 hypothetical protein HLVA_12540 [Haliovirga abyssi]